MQGQCQTHKLSPASSQPRCVKVQIAYGSRFEIEAVVFALNQIHGGLVSIREMGSSTVFVIFQYCQLWYLFDPRA